MADQYGVWSGMSIEEAKGYYDALYAIGTLSAIHYGVELRPFDENGLIATSPDITLFDNFWLPWLATSLDLSVLDAQNDSANVGHYQINYITGNSSGDIQIPFIETRAADILNSAKAIKSIMFNKDGTQAVPADYLMMLKAFIYDKHNRSTRVFEMDHLVALQVGSVPLEASNVNGVATVQLTFLKMFPMLVN